jgi:YVTN family beta-propeller protein
VKIAGKIAVISACLMCVTAPAFSATLVAKLHLGKEPYSPAINSVTHRLYTVNQTDQTVSVVDTTSNQVVATIPFSVEILYLAVNPVTNRIYLVTGYPASTVYVINGADNSIVTTIAIGNGGTGIAVDANSNRVYVANNADATISVIDGGSNSVTDTIAMPGNPNWLAIDESTQNVYVAATNASTFASTLYVISEASDAITETIALPGSLPLVAAVAVDAAAQRAYVVDNFAGALDVIDASTFTVTGTVSGVDSANCAAVNPFTHSVLVGNDTAADGQNVAAINTSTLQIVGRVHTPKEVLGVTVDPTFGASYVTLQIDGLAVFH